MAKKKDGKNLVNEGSDVKIKDVVREQQSINLADAGNTLSKELFLEMRVNHLEMDVLKKDLQNVYVQMESMDRAKMLSQIRVGEIKTKITLLEKKHKEFLDKVQKETGIDLRNSAINPETFEVSNIG